MELVIAWVVQQDLREGLESLFWKRSVKGQRGALLTVDGWTKVFRSFQAQSLCTNDETSGRDFVRTRAKHGETNNNISAVGLVSQ